MTIIMENINSYFLDMYGKYENIDEEVRVMVKSFYDPKVEERGIQKGIEEGIEKGIEKGEKNKAIEIAKNLLDILDDETISIKTGLTIEEVKRLRD